MTWKHGDILIATIDAIPGEVIRRPSWVLVEGEATGHNHRLDRSGVAERLDRGETLYLRVLAERAAVIDHRHRPITLPRGFYQLWKQRAYSSGAVRTYPRGDTEHFKTRRLTRRMREPSLAMVAGSMEF